MLLQHSEKPNQDHVQLLGLLQHTLNMATLENYSKTASGLGSCSQSADGGHITGAYHSHPAFHQFLDPIQDACRYLSSPLWPSTLVL